ncbi:MAG: LemA family protein [Elusimicrobiota bacterium]
MIPVLILGFIVVGVVLYLTTIYNSLVAVKNDVQKAWANIDVLLKQRHDELPKLIKTCETYMQYEQDTLKKVIELRSKAMGAGSVGQKALIEGELTQTLGKIFALAENYPNLKAEGTFQNLQTRISGLENQIADRREFYNESVNNYNIRIQSIPDMFVAGFMQLKAMEIFKVSESDREDVSVDMKLPS